MLNATQTLKKVFFVMGVLIMAGVISYTAMAKSPGIGEMIAEDDFDGSTWHDYWEMEGDVSLENGRLKVVGTEGSETRVRFYVGGDVNSFLDPGPIVFEYNIERTVPEQVLTYINAGDDSLQQYSSQKITWRGNDLKVQIYGKIDIYSDVFHPTNEANVKILIDGNETSIWVNDVLMFEKVQPITLDVNRFHNIRIFTQKNVTFFIDDFKVYRPAENPEIDVDYLYKRSEDEVRVRVTNTSGETLQGVFIVPLYDETGTLINVSLTDINVQNNDTTTVLPCTKEELSAGRKLKAFIWDSMSGIKPLSEVFTLHGFDR